MKEGNEKENMQELPSGGLWEGEVKMTIPEWPQATAAWDLGCGSKSRLVLRRIVPDDLPFFTRIHALPQVARHLYPESVALPLKRRPLS